MVISIYYLCILVYIKFTIQTFIRNYTKKHKLYKGYITKNNKNYHNIMCKLYLHIKIILKFVFYGFVKMIKKIDKTNYRSHDQCYNLAIYVYIHIYIVV